MGEAKSAWEQVGDRLSALGLKLKLHAEEESADEADTSGMEKLKKSINDVLDAIGDAARDPAVRDDAKAVGSAFADAIDATINEARKAMKPKAKD